MNVRTNVHMYAQTNKQMYKIENPGVGRPLLGPAHILHNLFYD